MVRTVEFYLLDADTETVIGGPFEDWRAARAARSDGETIATGHSLTELVPELRTDIDLSWEVPRPGEADDGDGDETVEKLLTDGSGYQITLDRTHVRDGEEIKEFWKASVNAEAYDEMGGQTPGRALRGLAREFDDVFGEEPRTDGGTEFPHFSEAPVQTGVDPDGHIEGIEMPLAHQVDFEWSLTDTGKCQAATVWMHAGHWELPVWSTMDNRNADTYLYQWFGTSPAFENGEREPLSEALLEIIADAVHYDYQSVYETREDTVSEFDWYEHRLVRAFVDDFTGARNPDGQTSGLMSVLFETALDHQQTGDPENGAFNPHDYDRDRDDGGEE